MFGVSSLLNPLLDSASTMSKLSVSEGTVNSDTRAQSFEEQEVNYRVELLLSPERLIVDVHEEVTTVFIDIGLNLCPKNPTSKEGDHPHVHAKQWSFLDGMDREERIQKLSLFFSLLDEAVEQFQIERIKTVNTKYLACSNMYLVCRSKERKLCWKPEKILNFSLFSTLIMIGNKIHILLVPSIDA